MNVPKLLALLTVTAGLLLIVTGCDVGGTSADGPKEVAVNMKLQPTPKAKVTSATSPTTLSVDTLTEIKFLVEELELESAIAGDTLDFEAEDLVVNLPLDGSEFQLTSKTVPEGVYEEFELEIENDDDVQEVNDPDFYDNDRTYSIVIKGVYNGEAFTYRSEEDFEIELELNPPLEITENSASFAVNISIDPAIWFADSQSGNSLDPTDPSNREKIDANIERSFEAESEEEDDDDIDDDDDNDEDQDEDDDDDD
ncbi:hypothetical protein ACG2F4_06325 [Halalkalibaculum sp. DA3122]|uniref:hypothetical protein n=1 Tax=unclassified Halalkalibaculum TaxID=2964617 RepID=UPI003754E475